MTRLRFVMMCGLVATTGCLDAAPAPDSDATPTEHALPSFRPATTVVSGCVTATAGQGFVTVAIPDATVLDTLTLTAQVDTVGIDAVVALSAGVPTSFNNLAAAFRFNDTGSFDARNNTAYASTGSFPYDTRTYNVKFLTDIASKQYSVLEYYDSMLVSEVGKRYAFRATATSTHLDHLVLEVDGPSGTLTVCNAAATLSSNTVYSREGNYNVATLASNQVVISDGTTTQKLNAAGATTATLANGGLLATDASGNISIAKVSGGTLTVDSYTSAFASRWHISTVTATGSDVIQTVSIDSAGTTHVATVTPGGGVLARINTISSAGVVGTPAGLAADWVAFDNDQTVTAYNDAGTLWITRNDASYNTVWEDAFPGAANVSAMAFDPSHGVIFGGYLTQPTDFGGGVLPTRSSENGPYNGYITKLSSTGAYVFAQRVNYYSVNGIAANATKIAASITDRTQFRYQVLKVYDPTGATVSTAFDPGFGVHGTGGAIALNSAGRVWWSIQTIWPYFPALNYLVAGTL